MHVGDFDRLTGESAIANRKRPHALSYSLKPMQRAVALTFDDFPAVGASGPVDAERINRGILRSLAKLHAPATAFVIQQGVRRIGEARAKRILRAWMRDGHDLGNHTFSHPDLNDITVEEFMSEVVSGEASIAAVLAGYDRSPRYLRFPYNHTGNTKEKHDSVAAFLSARKYTVATCTIRTSDHAFAWVYNAVLAQKELDAAQRLRAEYLAHTSAQIDYYSELHSRVFGREIPHVMLLHVNRLNADLMDSLLAIFEEKQYCFVTLDAAQSDPAYKTPDTPVTRCGSMWGYRWAKALGIEVNEDLEPKLPSWVLDWGKGAGN